MRILIADGDLRVRAALHVLLTQEGFLEPNDLQARESHFAAGADPVLIAECADLEGLIEQLHAFEPELVLLDWELPGRPAAAFLSARSHFARPKLIVLSIHPETRSAALAIGADAFVFKADPPEALLEACRQVMEEHSAGARIDVTPLPPP